MKTILLTVSRGSIARNILKNDFYEKICANFHVIILTPAYNDKRFLEEFSRPNVIFLPLQEKDHTFFDRIIFYFHKNLIYNATVAQKNKWGIPGSNLSKKPIFLSFFIKDGLFKILNGFSFLKEFFRFVDFVFLQKKEVSYFLNILRDVKPDIVFSTSISSDTEAALIKAAKKRHIPTIAMPKSWDNLSKFGFRVKADMFVVWSQFTKNQAIVFQNYLPEDVVEIGIPQFDGYVDKQRIYTREKFCNLYGLDPSLPIIFFGSEGKLFPTDSEIASILAEYVNIHQCQLLIRPHYGYKRDEKKFSHLFNIPHVTVDLFNNPSSSFRDEWDYSDEFTNRFINSMYHSDVIINTCSTLSLDGAAFDKPIISIGFDGYQDLPYEKSIRRWYETYYFSYVLKTQAVDVAYNKEHLFNLITDCRNQPLLRKKERDVLIKNFCGTLDGEAGNRLYSAIIKLLNIS